ncbi:MAG: TatD family hydrolase [Clostridia bacterium]|nr:TatD family hydrolase [Clostridia bacterium]
MEKLIDTHCHLNDDYFWGNAEEYINNFENDNLQYAFVVGYDFVSSKRALELAEKHENVYAIIGMHPSDAEKWNVEFEEFLTNNLPNKKVLALGEIGLDYHYENFSKQTQKQVFIKQLEIANKLGVPIVIHERDAVGDVVDILRQNKHLINNGGVVHCFNESVETYKIYKGFGLKFSFGGAITFKNSKNAPKLLAEVDVKDILLETDCPYLTPEPLRGKERNQPKNVFLVAKKIAEIKNMDLNELIKQTNKNVLSVFTKLKEI